MKTPESLINRSRFHNAVTLKFDRPTNLDEPANELRKLANVDHVEVDEQTRSMTAFPKGGESILMAISELAGAQAWQLEQLHLESGRLDEVFRNHHHDGGFVMNLIKVLAARELRAYFATPLAYVFLVIFLMLTGWFTFYMGGFYERGQADLAPFFNFHPWLYLFLVPAIAMRLWAEERKSGQYRVTDDAACHDDASRSWQVPCRLVLHRGIPGADVPDLDYRSTISVTPIMA